MRTAFLALLLAVVLASPAVANDNVNATWPSPRHFRHGGAPQALTISADGKHYAWAEERGAIYVADAASGEVVGFKASPEPSSGGFS